MKTVLLLAILTLLTGCFRQSATVTVGQDRTVEPNLIKDYSFYSHEFTEFFDALPATARRNVLAVTKVSDNVLRFSFPRITMRESDSAIVGLFQDFAHSNYKKRFEEWERDKDKILKPFVDMAENEPEIFKKRAIEMISMPLQPQVEVYILRTK